MEMKIFFLKLIQADFLLHRFEEESVKRKNRDQDPIRPKEYLIHLRCHRVPFRCLFQIRSHLVLSDLEMVEEAV